MASFITLTGEDDLPYTLQVELIQSMKKLPNFTAIQFASGWESLAKETVEEILMMKDSPVHCK